MSWSYSKSGTPAEVSAAISKEADQTDRYLSTNANWGYVTERALHARAVGLIIVACSEAKREHHVRVEAYGHFDGKHQHITVKFDGIDAPVEPASVATEVPATAAPSKAKVARKTKA